MQTGIRIVNDKVLGKLKYVTGYTGYSGDPDLQEGNYLALKLTNVAEGVTMTAELVNGHSGPVTMDSDLNVVFRIENKNTQAVKFTASKDGKSFSKVCNLRGLTCETE